MSRLDQKVALITGAAGGIGSACAEQFVARGASVFLVDIHEKPLRELADRLGPCAALCAADVSSASGTAEYFQALLDRFGRLDIAFLNAGIVGVVKPIDDTALDTFDRVMQVNVRGVWLGLTRALPLMREQGNGSIVITSSIAGTRGTACQGAYVASKHAVLGLMKTAALEGASHGVRVNAICPAPIDTEMMQALAAGIDPADHENGKRRVLAAIPLGRYGTAAEVANLVAFLASDDAAYCTGAAYMIDGGGTAGPLRK
jgi:NAD(P)-dependent dehydrogenase (short-subunit alcohol dehydrogenase family)